MYEQDCFGVFYEVLIISRRDLGLYAICVSLLTLPPSWKLETRARLRFGSASLETGLAAWHGTRYHRVRLTGSLLGNSFTLLLINGLSERVNNLQPFPYQTAYNTLDTFTLLLASTHRVKAGNLPIVVRN